MLGHQPPLFSRDASPTAVPLVDDWFKMTEQVWERVLTAIRFTVHRPTMHADQHRREVSTFCAGDQVWLATWDAP